MRPISEIRRARLGDLVAEYGGASRLATHIERDRRQISAWLASPEKAGHKDMSTTTARYIERRCLKPSGWLDHEADASVKAEVGSQPLSQSLRTDRQKMRDAMRLLAELAELQGVPALAHDPDAVSIAYDFLVEFDTPLTENKVLDMTKRLAAKIRGETDATGERSKTA